MSTFWDKENDGLWREGPYLVVRKQGAVFPDRCIMCNQPCYGLRMKCDVYVEPDPMDFVAPSYNAKGGFIARIKPGFCRQHAREELPMVIVGRVLKFGTLLLLLAGLVLIITAGVNGIPASVVFGLMLFFAGIHGFFVTLLVCNYRGRPVYGVMSKEGYVWIEKVHPDFLDALPEV